MNRYPAGIIAGFIATIVLSMLMLMKGAMGLMPDLNVIKMLTEMAYQRMGTPATPLVGWMMHIIIGSVAWGLLFAALSNKLPTNSIVGKGMIFGAIAWLLMMIGPMRMAGAGLFGLKMGMMAPVMTLILHLIFGAVLGAVYGRLASDQHVAASA